jgi:hypothetical protein
MALKGELAEVEQQIRQVAADSEKANILGWKIFATLVFRVLIGIASVVIFKRILRYLYSHYLNKLGLV